MADSYITILENINNLRYNPFTQAFTAYGHGYSGNPKEEYTIPASAPYWIYLNEIPKEESPSTLFINEKAGSDWTEVSFVTDPAASQFRVAYGGDGTTTQTTAGQGIVEFNSADAGKTVEVKYYGLGTINQKQLIDEIGKLVCPVGSIIGIHPDTEAAYLPDLDHWALCDGNTALDTTYIADTNDANVPDLTDDRFLMGDTAYGTGGNNSSSHTHSHNHSLNPGGTPNSVGPGTGTKLVYGVGGILEIASVGATTFPITGTTDSDASGANVTENRPLYFSVLYYIRIK